jgi:hypothetical protein
MSTKSKPRWVSRLAMAAVLTGAALVPSQARAEGPVTPDGKGIAGGAMLGAEVVMITTAAIGVKAWWPYVLFGAVGAGGGAVGGYFVESTGVAEPSLYMLAGGMALIVPTLVAVLNATAYEPEEDEEEGDIPADEQPGVDVEGGVNVQTGARRRIPLALLGLDASDGTRLSLGVPAVTVGPTYSPVEMSKYGLEQHTEVRVALVSATF